MGHCAAIVVGLTRKELSDTDLLLLKDFTLEEFCSLDSRGLDDNIIGLEYDSTISNSSEEIDWQEWVIGTIKEQFHTLTGKDAKVYLTVKEY